MDLVDFREEVFEEIRRQFEAFASKLEVVDVHFVPISALKGDNIVQASSRTKWFDGSTLLEYLEDLPVTNADYSKPLRLPIQYALLYPERKANHLKRWNPLDSPNLTFEAVDEETFSSIKLARESARKGGTMPCAMNAANEEAANGFLKGCTSFLRIPEIVEQVMERHQPQSPSLENLLEADRWARETARSLMEL